MSGRSSGRPPALVRQVALLLRREAVVERGAWTTATTVLPSTVAAVVLAGLAVGPDRAVLRAAAPGIVWLVVLVTAVPLARVVAAAERSDDAWDLLRSLVHPTALLAAKVLWLWCALLLTWAVAAVLAVPALGASWPVLSLVVALLATLGLAAHLAVLGAVLGATGGRQAVLGTLVLVAGLPPVVAGAQSAVAPDALQWLVLVLAWDAVVLSVAWACFPLVVEE